MITPLNEGRIDLGEDTPKPSPYYYAYTVKVGWVGVSSVLHTMR